MISAISSEGLLAAYLLPLEKRFNADTFVEFLDRSLIPAMNAYNGMNPRSVIIMGEIYTHIKVAYVPRDIKLMEANQAYIIYLGIYLMCASQNVRNDFVLFFVFFIDNHVVHCVREVVEHVYNSGAIIRFLPPYSPDLNPIEEAFAKVKRYLRQNDLVLQSVADPSPLVWDAFGQITPNDCQGYMNHAGYI